MSIFLTTLLVLALVLGAYVVYDKSVLKTFKNNIVSGFEIYKESLIDLKESVKDLVLAILGLVILICLLVITPVLIIGYSIYVTIVEVYNEFS